MVILTFVFNKEKVRDAGYTEDELLEPMRQHARKYGIDEIEYGVFAKDGNQALGAIGRYAVDVSESFVYFLEKWTLNVNGQEEDCIEAFHRCKRREYKYA